MKEEFKSLIFTCLFVIGLSMPLAITAQQKVEKATKKEMEWFASKRWLDGLQASPDPSIDVATFSKHYKKHPERWVKAFEFLKENDLKSLPTGKQTLTEGLTVSVEEYTTREPGKEWLEGHKKNIDLQFIVEGCELQGYAKIQTAAEIVNPYTDKKDVGHYLVPTINYHVIRPYQFTIFFPDDIHMTNIQYGEKAKVRKIVFKVAVD